MDYKEKIIALLNSQELSKEQKEKLESIFPALKESDDERIRKALIELVHDTTGDSLWVDYDVHKEAAIAWLEKQGETFTKKDVDDAYLKGVCDTKHELEKQGEQKPAEFDDTNAKRMFIKALERVEEQNNKGYKLTDCDKNSWWEDFKNYTSCTIEQKPAEWSEKDETTKNNISHIIRQYDKISKRENKPCWYIGDCLLWMQNIKDRVQLQPKQEWKQENTGDLTDFENAMMCVGESFFGKYAGLDPNDTNAIKGQANLLLELVSSKEWSEEEKVRIDKIVDVLDWAEEKGYIRYSDWEDYICYVKSLRPQNTWKPSDEQIIELRRVISGCSYDIEPLVEIEEHLKKLREE